MLGELFDHGCDSVTTIFVSLGIAIALKVSMRLLRLCVPLMPCSWTSSMC